MIFKERSLWPSSGLRLNCKKQKYFSCQAITNYKLCIKKKKYELCIKSKKHSNKYHKNRDFKEYICCKKYS